MKVRKQVKEEILTASFFKWFGYTDDSYKFKISNYDCSELKKIDFVDKASSAIIPEGLEVALYDNCFNDGKNEYTRIVRGPV